EFACCWIGLLVADGVERLEVVASYGSLQQAVNRQRLVDASGVGWRSPALGVLSSGEPVIVDDPVNAGQNNDWVKVMLNAGVGGLIYLPLKDQDRVFGVICLACEGPVDQRSQDIGHLRELANSLSIGVVSRKARQERRK